ncbi:hypothetical protein CH299_28875 [Rhodococcus sp. 14-2686-1-2]|nr:hypothetical protein CH299_28875 [Rhodococcus sp. 14-2686-1-2]
MRSDREEIPAPFSKEDADKAEIGEARSRTSRVADVCQWYWPSPYQVCGAIRDKYNSLGGPGSFLSYPTSGNLVNPGNTGERVTFLNGPIYWSQAGGAHPVLNHFMMKWGQLNWEAGYLGYPKSDEIVLPSSTDNIGRKQDFTGGTIFWHPTRSSLNAVKGAILDKYLTYGPGGAQVAQNGYLGYPRSDELVLPDGVGRITSFEFGNIYFTPATGAHPVLGNTNPEGAIGRILGKWAATGYEQGPYGYPTGDEIPRPPGGEQQFQRGKIAWPFVNVDQPGGFADTDWQEDYVDENTTDCEANSCANDARMALTSPGTHARTASRAAAESGPDIGQEPAPEAPIIPDCSALPADPSADPTKMSVCILDAPLTEEQKDPTAGSPDSAAPDSDPAQRAPSAARANGSILRDYCGTLTSSQWGGDRTYECVQRQLSVGVKKNNETIPFASFTFGEEHQITTYWNKAHIDSASGIHITDVANGSEMGNFRVKGVATCSTSGCDRKGDYVTTSGNLGIGSDVENEYQFGAAAFDSTGVVSLPVDTTKSLSTAYRWTFVFDNPDIENAAGLELSALNRAPVRCDNMQSQGMRTKPGCATSQEPILDYANRSNLGELNEHIRLAQDSGLPGRFDELRPLTRTTTAVTSNRAASCNKVPGPREPGKSCDEYPFASSQQGAASGNPGRTFTGCFIPDQPELPRPDPGSFSNGGYSMCQINARQNSRGGGILNWFYVKNRILNGDTFYVNVR